MQHILGISGSKQSGKTTCANYLHGYQMRFHDVIEKFLMNERGEIIVNTMSLDEKGEEVERGRAMEGEMRGRGQEMVRDERERFLFC